MKKNLYFSYEYQNSILHESKSILHRVSNTVRQPSLDRVEHCLTSHKTKSSAFAMVGILISFAKTDALDVEIWDLQIRA